MEFVVRIIEALAWPIAAVWLGYAFRSEVRELLARVSKLKYKDAEAHFEREVLETSIETPQLPKPITKNSELDATSQASEERLQEWLRIAESSPRAAVLEAWIQVERELGIAAERLGVEANHEMPAIKLGPKVLEADDMTKGMVNLFNTLRKLRNEAAHRENFHPSYVSVEKYLELTQTLVHALRIAGVQPV